ncbi:hypothetical protein ACNR9Q_03670 [Maribacter sp. X9]|uniref:hypothetical protein n=1 Tax=Maribacter sp. X9 TaxID=3402159 RepID=UPI003AF3A756
MKVRHEVKQKMIAGLDKEELVLLKFTESESQSELRWEHSKEFEYKGQMYDVVSQEVQGDTIKYWCWLDHEETDINKRLQGLVDSVLGKDPQRNSNKEKLAHFYKSLFWKKYPYFRVWTICEANLKISQKAHYHNLMFSPPVPPPEET